MSPSDGPIHLVTIDESARRSLAWARRDENLDRLWEDVIRLGFDLVDDDARPLARRTALGSRTTVHLSRKMCPFSIDRRIGFFTHSLIGNALILLGAPDDAEFPDATGAATGCFTVRSRRVATATTRCCRKCAPGCTPSPEHW